MRVRSSDSVKIFSLEVDEIIEKLQESVRRLKSSCNDVIEVYLFGSLAKGDFVPGSDADIMVLLRDSKDKFIDRIGKYMDFFSDIEIGVDIFPYTIEELDRAKREEDPFIKEILSHKIKL